MSQLKRGILALAGMSVFALATVTCVSVPEDLDTEGCIEGCTVELTECLGTQVDCPDGDACLIEAGVCFNKADDCVETCTMQDDDTCVNECSDMVNSCVDVMWRCISEKEECIRREKDTALTCLPPYGSCAAACVGEAEDAIKDMT